MQGLFKVIFVFMLTFIAVNAIAQLPEDLSKFKSYQINDDQLKKYIQQAGASGLTEADIEVELKKRGLPDSEVILVRQRIRNIMNANTKTAEGSIQNIQNRENADSLGLIKNPGLPTGTPPSAKLFGADLFSTTSIGFEPNLKVPTPINYILGPGDQLYITIFGINEAQQSPQVGLDGSITLKYLGPVYVNGLTIEEGKKRIYTLYTKVYPQLRSGKSQLQITLGAIRSIKVTLLGSIVRAGTYTLPSLATVYNALYASGGPDEYGSFREIELIRDNKVVQKIDIYNYLLYGDRSQDLRLEDRDVIRIPMAKKRVSISGEVKKSGIFEVFDNENLGLVLDKFSGGFQRSAYSALLKVERITTREKKLIDVPKSEFYNFKLEGGDIITIDKILDRYENAVKISGSVFRPGTFALESGMGIKELIIKADGFTEEAFKDKAILSRLKDDKTKEILFVDLSKIFSNSRYNIPLRKDDELIIKNIFEFKDDFTVSIFGGVRKPGVFPHSDSMRIKDLIYIAGGLQEDTYFGRGLLTKAKLDGTTETKAFSLDSLFSGQSENFILERKDIIKLLSNSDLINKYPVSIYGEIKKPGSFEFSTNMTFKNLLFLAGGFTEKASIINIEVARRVKSVNPNDPNALLSTIINVKLDTTGLSIDKNDFTIEPYDIISVKNDPFKKLQETIAISGQVLYPGTYAVQNRQDRISAIVKRAGGALIEANVSGASLRRLKNGTVINKETVDKISKQAKDSLGTLGAEAITPYDDIAIDLEDALKNPGGGQDIFVKNGDELIIPRIDQMVDVNGEVLHPIKLAYKSGRRLIYYIGAAGGFVSSANKRKTFVVYPNGKASRTKKIFIFFRKYPRVLPGSQVFVPKESIDVRPKKSATEILATASAVSTLAYLIIFISNQIK